MREGSCHCLRRRRGRVGVLAGEQRVSLVLRVRKRVLLVMYGRHKGKGRGIGKTNDRKRRGRLTMISTEIIGEMGWGWGGGFGL